MTHFDLPTLHVPPIAPLGATIWTHGLPSLTLSAHANPSHPRNEPLMHYADPAAHRQLPLQLPAECRCYATPLPGDTPDDDMREMGEVIRALTELRAREEFGPDFTLPVLGELWSGPLCLTHDEGVHFLLDTLRHRDDLSAIATYLANEYLRVESGRDAALAGEWDVFGEAVAQSTGDLAKLLNVPLPPPAASSITWLQLGPTPTYLALSWSGSGLDSNTWTPFPLADGPPA